MIKIIYDILILACDLRGLDTTELNSALSESAKIQRNVPEKLKKKYKHLLFSLSSSSPTVQDIVFQLQRFVSGMSHYYDECYAVLKEADVFPIEVDLSRTMINYSSQSLSSYAGDEEDEEEQEEEGGEGGSRQAENGAEKLIDDE